MNSQEKTKIILYIIYSVFFLLLTTNYLTLNGLIYDANQTDIISYTSIAKESPYLPKNNEIIIQHVAQRFLIPYIVGLISKTLNIEIFSAFKISTMILVLCLIFTIIFVIKKLKLNFNEGILFFSLFFF